LPREEELRQKVKAANTLVTEYNTKYTLVSMEVAELKQKIEKLKRNGEKKVAEPGNKKRKLNEFEDDMLMFDLKKPVETSDETANTSTETKVLLKPKRIIPMNSMLAQIKKLPQ